MKPVKLEAGVSNKYKNKYTGDENKCATVQLLICMKVISYWKLTEIDESYSYRALFCGHRTAAARNSRDEPSE